MHGHSGVEVRGRPADILRVSPVGETLIAGLSGACLHPLSLLGSPLIFFSFFLFLIQGLTLWLRRVQFMAVLLPQSPQCWMYRLHWLMSSAVCGYLMSQLVGNSGLTFQEAARLRSKVVCRLLYTQCRFYLHLQKWK